MAGQRVGCRNVLQEQGFVGDACVCVCVGAGVWCIWELVAWMVWFTS